MTQRDLFATTVNGAAVKAKPATEKRDRAMKSAETNAPPGWNTRARAAVVAVARTHDAFTTDDVWKSGLDRPPNPRALGPVMRAVANDGSIEATPNFQPTTQQTRNAAPVRVWRSLIRRERP